VSTGGPYSPRKTVALPVRNFHFCQTLLSIKVVGFLLLLDMATNRTYTNRSASLRLLAAATEHGELTNLYYHQAILYSNNVHSFKPEQPHNDTRLNDIHNAPLKAKHNKYADLNGGFIRFKDRKRWAYRLGISDTTFRIRFAEMARKGYLRKKYTGWQIVSMKNVAAMFGIQCNSLDIRGLNKEDFKLNQTKANIKTVISRQDKATHKERNTMRGKLSLMTITKMNGNKCAMTAWKRVNKLEKKLEVIVVTPDPEIVCKRSELKQGIVAHYIVGNDCYYQPANQYIIIKNGR